MRTCLSPRRFWMLNWLPPRRACPGWLEAPDAPAWPDLLSVMLLVPQRWIQRIAQTIPHEVEAEHGQRDHQCREKAHVPVHADVAHAVPDHFAPAGYRVVDAEAQEAQARLG